MIQKTDHDLIVEMHTVLLGANGQPGLCADFEEHKKNEREFRKDYYNFKRWAIGIFCFVSGSGVLGLGIVKVSQLVSG